MKTGNTLRTAKNSLLCFFMALAGGFLVACGGDGVRFTGGGGTPTPPLSAPPVSVAILSSVDISQPPPVIDFPAYLVDTAVEGVSYSGPTGSGETGKGGAFLASEGEFVFSIGGTTLGSVQMSSNQENNEVTPADFIGVNEAQVITIARVMQALDEDAVSGPGLQNGISISQATRDDPEGVSLLYSMVGTDVGEISGNSVGDNNQQYTIPSADNAEAHLAATRRCLFSGGYVGNFEGTVRADNSERRGQVYYAVEPFANRVRTFVSSTVSNEFESFQISVVGVIGSTITLSEGNELSFITPRLVAGVWQVNTNDGSVFSSGTENLTIAADTGNPGATRRIVGVETAGAGTVAGMYVLDYFEGATVFLGRHYEVDATSGSVSSMPLSLTIANDPSWPVSADGGSDGMMTVTLTLSGMRGEEDASITVGIVRADGLAENANENYGSFEGVGNELSGTWCDIGGAVGSTVAPTPPEPTPPLTAITIDWSAVEGATVYNLYRSVSVGGAYTLITTVPPAADDAALSYVDRPSAGEYFYRVEYCKSDDDCSVIPQDTVRIEITWSAVEGASFYKLYRSTVGGTSVTVDGNITVTSYVDTPPAGPEYSYQVESCNSAGCSDDPDPAAGGGDGNGGAPPDDTDDGMCKAGDVLMVGDSCEWNGHTFSAESGGLVIAGPRVQFDSPILTRQYTQQIGSDTLVATRDGTTWTITRADGNDGDGNGGGTPMDMDDGQCRVGQTLMSGESCQIGDSGATFMVSSGGSAVVGGFPQEAILYLSEALSLLRGGVVQHGK